MKFKAGTLDTRNVGSRIGVTTNEENVYGVIASVRQLKGEGKTKIFLTDNEAPLSLDATKDVEIQLGSPELATINANNVLERLEGIANILLKDRTKN